MHAGEVLLLLCRSVAEAQLRDSAFRTICCVSLDYIVHITRMAWLGCVKVTSGHAAFQARSATHAVAVSRCY
jgi:hypothetical protein